MLYANTRCCFVIINSENLGLNFSRIKRNVTNVEEKEKCFDVSEEITHEAGNLVRGSFDEGCNLGRLIIWY